MDGKGPPSPTIPPIDVTLTLTGGISGAGNLTKVGGGRLILAAQDTYNGTTDIRDGTLTVLNDEALSEGSTTTVENGATLDFQGTRDGRRGDHRQRRRRHRPHRQQRRALTSTGQTTIATLTGRSR